MLRGQKLGERYMIAAFVGTNREFRAYLAKQKAKCMRETLGTLKSALNDLKHLSGFSINRALDGDDGWQVSLCDLSTLAAFPGQTEIRERESFNFGMKYEVTKKWQGIRLFTYASDREMQSVWGEDHERISAN